MTKHTPGPWFTHESSVYANTPQEAVGRWSSGWSEKETSNGVEIGYLIAESIPHAPTRSLIAAAPDLLDACMQMIWANDNQDAEEYENAIASARIAVSKAEGADNVARQFADLRTEVNRVISSVEQAMTPEQLEWAAKYEAWSKGSLGKDLFGDKGETE